VPAVVAAVWLLLSLLVMVVRGVVATALLGQQAVLREQSILVAVEVEVEVLPQQAVKAAQASSSSPTQAQHKNSAVELLPNQAVTSFTHSHLLAHLALCHL
jgi:hypothetical protein